MSRKSSVVVRALRSRLIEAATLPAAFHVVGSTIPRHRDSGSSPACVAIVAAWCTDRPYRSAIRRAA